MFRVVRVWDHDDGRQERASSGRTNAVQFRQVEYARSLSNEQYQ